MSDPARTGLFVAFEGGEGAGKSTQVMALAQRLADLGHRAVLTREPGGTPIGEQIRLVLLGAGSVGMDPRTEALLFAAARAEHAAKLIRPERAMGAVVISDRYVDSSVAYQGYARGLGPADVDRISMWATDGLRPDLTVLLDIAPRSGLARAGDPNRMEGEPTSFHESVAQGFRELAASEPSRYLVVDATAAPEQITSQVLQAVLQLLDSPTGSPAA